MGDEARAPDLDGYLPLTPAVLDIVLALGDGELHGYGIMREVSCRTDGGRRLAPGTLYRSLRQMQEKGLVEESEERPDAGRPRRRATPLLPADGPWQKGGSRAW